MEEATVLFEDYEEGQDLCQEADFQLLADNYYSRSAKNDKDN